MVTSTWWNRLTLFSRDICNGAYLQRKRILRDGNITKEKLPKMIYENSIISKNLTKRLCGLLFSNKGWKKKGM